MNNTERDGAAERNILLCVTGLAPQIITETLYGLAVQREPRFIPDEIHLVTTAQGAEWARLTLLSPDERHFYHLCDDYGLDATAIRFGRDTIHVIHSTDGEPLDDIRTPEDNEAAADTIVEVVRELSADPASRIHASLAGGRKTMGFYLGYALSLFGREQDELSHVLVSHPFEANPNFFYPPRQPRVLYTRENQPIHTEDARITLADIPFVRLRDSLPDMLRGARAGFSQTVRQAQMSLEAPHLVLDIAHLEVRCREQAIRLPPVDFAFYLWLVRRAQNDAPPVRRKEITDEEAEQFLAAYRTVTHDLAPERERVEKAVSGGIDFDYFDQRKHKVNSELRHMLGSAATPYQIQKVASRPQGQFKVALTPEQITIVV